MIVSQPVQLINPGFRISGMTEESSTFPELAHAGNISQNKATAAARCVEYAQSKGFVERWVNEDTGPSESAVQLRKRQVAEQFESAHRGGGAVRPCCLTGYFDRPF